MGSGGSYPAIATRSSNIPCRVVLVCDWLVKSGYFSLFHTVSHNMTDMSVCVLYQVSARAISIG